MKFFLAILISFLLPVLNAQESPSTSTTSPATPFVENTEKQFNFFPGGKLQVSMDVPGSLKIIGWQKSSIRIEVERIVHYLSQENAKALLQKSPIRVRYTPTSAVIQTTGSPEPPGTMEVNLTLYIPGDKTDIALRMDRGDFFIDSVNGWIEASIGEGNLEAKSLAGYFSCITQRGNIQLELSGKRWRGREFAALTHHGAVDLRLPSDFSAAIQFETRNGKISVDFPPQIVDGEEMPPDILINKNAQSLKAAIGDGGAPIKLVTYSGNITLSRKE
jgi:DUF4097 and DUF4098 domain-containing protein YvlB